MHKPVMLAEVLEYLPAKRDGVFIDLTGGFGGHSAAINERLSSDAKHIIIDRDPESVQRLRERFKGVSSIEVFHENFGDFNRVLDQRGIERVDGLLADFGLSTMQVRDGSRGFSFREDGPLDMRMDNSAGFSAADVVNTLTREELSGIIKTYGEERFAWRIAGAIENAREEKPFETTLELADTVASAVPAKFRKKGINPATKTFQAIRIHVNGELREIESMLSKLEDRVNPGGRVAFISFHSLEDRLVKEKFRELERECICPPKQVICNCDKERTFKILTRKPIAPGEAEVEENPLSRSAKLRVAERVSSS
ncbi:16S rRNA (cytosine(1402)-N(4))-methyltransferase RsmH [Limisalsivibrio acetivorans]|uniref:16S rRNA (cytosine(1402)-N(4))-methyltransferase RsmH n=1 Tax=Limisalsivibrio acetivorans TaxID=1304888 RepID=UPI0003B675B8|nr:16S rRNA (cytosine(1402)-N(4))-methyltransferase RsmH [Limisalsivibrio acetivorans]